MVFVVSQLEVRDFDAWKLAFNSDFGGRREIARGHQVLRGVDDPNQVFVVTEYASAEDAKSSMERFLASGVLGRVSDNVTVTTQPVVTEQVESERY